jgi:hypothetical protein
MILRAPFRSFSRTRGPWPPSYRKLIKNMSNIYGKFLNTTQSLSIAGVLGPIKNIVP